MSYLLTVLMACSSGSSSNDDSPEEKTNAESPINPTPPIPSESVNDEAALGETNAHTVGGTVVGLSGGTIVVQNNSSDSFNSFNIPFSSISSVHQLKYSATSRLNG